ncbi:SAF domain-containing protein [Catellatospora vulcania]|uniref:SAF domain-containing protein n=1 Tax=Catellatospora vulcania TaxID=1460450 RepID=UPI0012D42C4F|nr:SAF domain-containing protein [Catellatospora vulcania]
MSVNTSAPARALPAAPIQVPRTAPRRRSVAQGALAVLLIIVGALTAGYVAQRVGGTHDYLAVARPVGKGGLISREDLLVVRVNQAVGLRPIPAANAAKVIGKRAVMALVPGTLLTLDQVTETPVPAPGHQLIGIALGEDRMPSASRLSVGSQVLLVVVPERGGKDEGPDLVPPRTVTATIVQLAAGTRSGQWVINVEVATVDAPSVAALAADDRIVLALDGS